MPESPGKDVEKLILTCVLLLYLGAYMGLQIDGNLGSDPFGDGVLKGLIVAAVVCVIHVVLTIPLDPVRVSKRGKRRAAAKNTRDAARRREEERRDRQYWKRVYWERTH
ncbi:hypothetical protein GWI34_27965 [Actinomadura sp. DSM 109109]|nr:hypothetical protein [Actinomadura lepetitiana]